MNKPIVSVITLTYRNYDNLEKTIKSVMAQDYDGFEYIISDDGSGDFPLNEVKKIIESDNSIKQRECEVIVNEKNVGTVKHLNNVIKRCRGDYIVILPGNDIFINSNSLSDIVKAFQNNQCDVLICSRATYADNEIKEIIPHVKDWKKVKKLDSNIKLYSALMRTEHYGMFIGINTYYKKSIIAENGFFDEKYTLFEDAPMLAEVTWNARVSLRPDLITVLYDGKTGVSAKGNINPILKKDIKLFNQYGKLEHFDDLDWKTRYHIRFGVRREEAKSGIELCFVCLLYFPRIVSYGFYCLGRKIAGRGDTPYIKKVSAETKLD